MKYLLVENFAGQTVPFIFPSTVDHSDMREQLPYGQVIACGSVSMGPNGFVCSGGNKELGLQSRGAEDAAIIAQALSQN